MRSLLGPGLPLIALALVACRPPAQPAPESPGCEAPRHRAASGACVDCLHDADCPVGQRCDPLAGVCAPPRPPVDAGPGPGCAPTGLRCSADLGAVQECQAFADGGTDWVTTQLCDGLTCDTDLRVCKVCQPRTELCLPDAGSGAYARCRDNGTGYDSLSCSAGFVCLDVGPGAISCRLCEPNSLTCATAPDGGQGILSCDATGKVQAYHSCYPTNLCTNTDEGPTCGSFICYPGSHQCAFPDGGSMPDYTSPARQVCSTDGRSWLDDPCPADTLCGPMGQDPGACLTPCDQVLQSDQDLGCDFWGALTSNRFAGAQANDFSVAVSNISDHLTAHATLEAPGAPAVTATVAPQSIGVLPLPGPMMCGTSQAALGYHLTTDAPVTAVQFNPLSASASGDASLLLPAQHLGTTYAVVSVPHGLQDDGGALPGLLAVVATEDGTQVHIQLAGGVASTQSALASGACASAPDNLAAQASQTSADYLLNRAEVLQLWTDASSSDLTGSMITSTSTQSGGGAPVAVFGGADCAAVPTGAASCDHLEEQLPPFGIWGKRYLGVKSQPYAGASSTYPDVWRLVSACGPGACPNGATVTITPPVASFHADPAHPSATCSTAGATTTCVLPSRSSSDTAPWIEFQHASTFVATSDQPALLAQYLVSQGTAGAQEGDPSLVLAPDASRWMSFNLVLAPASFAHNGLSLMIDGHSPSTCQSCGQVQVDGVTTPASEWANVPGTNYWAAVHPVCGKADPGCHPEHIISTTNGEPVGVVVYGYDSFVSYAYPGALGPPALVHIQPG